MNEMTMLLHVAQKAHCLLAPFQLSFRWHFKPQLSSWSTFRHQEQVHLEALDL